MTEQKHTAEPWSTDRHWITKGEGDDVPIICETHRDKNKSINDGLYESRHNAKRIVSCVNAMSGIDDPEKWVEEVRAVLMKYADKENWSETPYETSIGAVKNTLMLEDQWNGNSSNGWAIAKEVLSLFPKQKGVESE